MFRAECLIAQTHPFRHWRTSAQSVAVPSRLQPPAFVWLTGHAQSDLEVTQLLRFHKWVSWREAALHAWQFLCDRESHSGLCPAPPKEHGSDPIQKQALPSHARPCDALSPRRSHARKLKSGVGTWALAAWSLISVGLGGKGILVAPSITLERRHKAALNKVGPGDSSNSGDSASISIDAAVSLKLSKVFSVLAHFSTIGPGETLLLKTYSNTFRCCGRWKLKHCRSGGWALFWAGMSDKCSPTRKKKSEKYGIIVTKPNGIIVWQTDKSTHKKRKERSRGGNVVNPQLLKCAYLCECVCLAVYHESLVGLH